MFSYYGSKSKHIKLYPKPKQDRIVEPFAGSARYALEYFETPEIVISDISPYVYKTWKYLQQASEKDILSLPIVPSKVNIDTYDLTEAEKYLIGYCLCRGKSKPRKVGHGFNSWERDRERIATNLYKIRHWTILDKPYWELEDKQATWFIDPPYQSVMKRQTDKYPYWEIDYQRLAEWIKSRPGFTIACEGADADYLPFEFLAVTGSTSNRPNYEYIYTH